MKYELWDSHEKGVFEFGELLCISDSMTEIRAAAKERMAETDGECELVVMERIEGVKA